MVASTTLLSWQTCSTQLCYVTHHHHTPSVFSRAEHTSPQSKHTQISLPNVHKNLLTPINMNIFHYMNLRFQAGNNEEWCRLAYDVILCSLVYTRCFTSCEHYCARLYHGSPWSKKVLSIWVPHSTVTVQWKSVYLILISMLQ
jgi:hypothetical protein